MQQIALELYPVRLAAFGGQNEPLILIFLFYSGHVAMKSDLSVLTWFEQKGVSIAYKGK
jgi:hypothetical protein